MARAASSPTAKTRSGGMSGEKRARTAAMISWTTTIASTIAMITTWVEGVPASGVLSSP